jgi:hypothetical protein
MTLPPMAASEPPFAVCGGGTIQQRQAIHHRVAAAVQLVEQPGDLQTRAVLS